MQEEAKAALQHAANTMKLYYDHNCLPSPEYQIGNLIWLNLQDYSTNHSLKKLDHKWSGPFKITKLISSAAVKLSLPSKFKGIHPVISTSKLCPYHPDNILEHPLT